MPTRPVRRSRILERAAYARTGRDFLINDPDGFPSDFPPSPATWWIGLDSGGGAYPIGPNGPWTNGYAAAVPAVTRATALITGPLTGAPFRVLDATGQPTPTPRWMSDPMLSRPTFTPGYEWPSTLKRVRSVFWAEWIRSAIWWGVGAFVWQADSAGEPLAGTLFVIHPGTLSTVRDSDTGVPLWTVGATDDFTGQLTFDRDGFDAESGLHITVLRNPLSSVDTEGMSQGVFAMSPSAFSLAGTIDTYQAGQFRAGVPNGYLKTEVPGMTKTQADDLKAKWMAAHGGSTRSIAVLNSTTQFVPINLSPVDAALDQVKRLNIADVAFAFNLDPMTLGAGLNNSATYTNLRDAWENHRDFGLGPWIAAAQDTLSAILPGSQSAAVNLDGFANPAPAERFNAWKVAIDARILDAEEVRAIEGLPPRDNPPPVTPAAPAGPPPAPASDPATQDTP
jgi:HK97 family phage portal protein